MASSQLPDSVLSHVSLGSNDIPKAIKFYSAVLATLQIQCLMAESWGAGYGRKFPEFWIQGPHDGKPATVGNGVHISFLANSIEEVNAFHATALELGGRDDGKPGYRKEYSENYYAAFVRDLDGNKIEAMLMV